MAEEKMTKETIEKIDAKVEESKVTEAKEIETETPKTEKKTEVKEEKKTETKKDKVETKVAKKEMAMANGFSLKISPKQSKFVCRVIKGKSPESAVERLEAVITEKRVIPMASLEIGHRKGKGLAGGRYPKNACKAIIEIIKQAGANAVVAGIDNPVITIAKADKASEPYRRSGTRGRRAHIHIEIRDKKSLIKAKKK